MGNARNDDDVKPGREYPSAPVAGVAAVVLHGDQVLLIRRGREPLLGAWSLPGGALELGETSAEGAAREVLEETALRVRPTAVITSIDRIHCDQTGRVQYHYVLIEWLCFPEDQAEPKPGDDAAEVRWVHRSQLADYNLGESTLSVIHQALGMAEAIRQ